MNLIEKLPNIEIPMPRLDRAIRQAKIGARRWLRARARNARDEVREMMPPSLWLLLRESGYVVSEVRGRRNLQALASGRRQASDRRPILLIPGFLANPNSLHVLYASLRLAGYRARHWNGGRNCGDVAAALDLLEDQLEDMADRFGQPVTVIGWSLGGLYAREIAKRHPDLVREVITMATPFSGPPRANNMWWVYERVCGYSVDNPPVEICRSEKPPVPTTAMWSAWDGCIPPAAARGEPDERDRTIEVMCSHLEFCSHPRVIERLLDHLESTRDAPALSRYRSAGGLAVA